MLHRLLSAVLSLPLLSGCAAVDAAREGGALKPGRTYVLGLEGAWAPGEVAQVAAACVDWAGWSRGRLLCRLAEGPGDAVDGVVRRAPTGAALDDGRPLYLRLAPLDRALVVDVEGLRAAGFGDEVVRAAVGHLLGRAARMPLHDEPGGVLARRGITADFGAADAAGCRAAGVCPADDTF